MSLSALFLILLSAFLHATWNALLKNEKDKQQTAVIVLLIAAFASLFLAPFISLNPFANRFSCVWSIAAGLGEMGYFIFLALALTYAPVSLAYTITRGTALLFIWPVSMLAFGEKLDWISITGVLLVCGGLTCMGLAHMRKKTEGLGILFSILCAVFIAAYHYLYKRAILSSNNPPAVVAVALFTAIPINFLRLSSDQRRTLPNTFQKRWKTHILAGITCAASFLIMLFLLRETGVGAILTLRNTSVVFAMFLSLMIGERPSRVDWIGALLITIGAICVGLTAPMRQ